MKQGDCNVQTAWQESVRAMVHERVNGSEGLCLHATVNKLPKAGEVSVRIQTAGLNHRDLFIMKERRDLERSVVLGSDGAGVVAAVGEGIEHIQVGDEVIIHPTLNWTRTNEMPQILDILGYPSDGTFAEYVVVPVTCIEKKPAYLTWEEAGVLPLAALTAYRALFTRGELISGEHVLITGIGGGVATYALMMAKAAGAKVTVTSRSEEKRLRALGLGADRVLASDCDWSESLHGEPVNLIIDSIGPAVFTQFLQVLAPGGRVVQFGRSSGDKVEISLSTLFRNQYSILATSMGSAEEFCEMLQYIETHRIRPVIDKIYPLEQAVQAFKRMEAGEQFGNIGLKM
ncbi:quinone oxidoreductase family protein [Paenibacillus arenosi]|uniref:Zinc-binding dehydrogenase n=1 Tax=Paenibacillus arenosi TaxID=2774142 RepID=A0ABR9B133_9BACL|nr:zinc-binding dehydrogenase [Paenibacillus arenosi]MBD8500070.1 zinc-binding dehydrogenase [Paenibacillus arenosi]